MLNSKSKKAGFVGTLCFHLILLIIVFFSSIGYTYIEPSLGLEIEFIPYTELDPVQNINTNNDNNESQNSKITEDNIVEKMILEENITTTIPSAEDTLTLLDDNEKDPSESISLELEQALSKFVENSFDDIVNNTEESTSQIEVSINNNTKLDDLQDGYELFNTNRSALNKVKPQYNCDESGTIVVRVWVNQKGVTIKAEAGVRGSTESASCLLEEAKNAALQTTWIPDFDSPELQLGAITYNFHKY